MNFSLIQKEQRTVHCLRYVYKTLNIYSKYKQTKNRKCRVNKLITIIRAEPQLEENIEYHNFITELRFEQQFLSNHFIVPYLNPPIYNQAVFLTYPIIRRKLQPPIYLKKKISHICLLGMPLVSFL